MHGVTAASPAAPVRVSVVVPVFRPGAGFDDLIASLDRQTLQPHEFEVLLCDDGSGQPTQARLAEVARTRPHVRVLTLPHSGWPGAPRNAGVDAARGTYVQFVDQDDWLFDGALEDLCDYADRYDSDVIIGKEVGIGRRMPRQIFRDDIPRAVLGKDPILEVLTPHKMFRTSFLRAHGIRFPEGRVRLEDHLFVMQAYFAAATISVLASRPCYAWVKNDESASASRIDPVTYFPHLETVLDLVEANTEPGRQRDTLLRHWYRGKILNRLEGRRFVRYPPEYREEFLDVVTPISRARFGPGVDAGLAFPLRVRSALLREDRREDLLRFAEFEAGIGCRAEITAAKWTPRGALRLDVRVRFDAGPGEAPVFGPATARDAVAAGGAEATMSGAQGSDAVAATPRGAVWHPPAGLGADFLPVETRDAARDLKRDRVDLVLRDEAEGQEYAIPGTGRLTAGRARVTIDPISIFTRRDRTRGGSLVADVRHAGWSFRTPLRAEPGVLAALRRPPFLAGSLWRLTEGPDGTVELIRDGRSVGRVRDLAARAVRRARSLARRVVRRLPIRR